MSRFELITKTGATESFISMRSALEAAEKRRLRSYQLWEIDRDQRILRFEAST